MTLEEKKQHRANYKEEVPSVYCGTYGKYNIGSLEGMWIDISSFDNGKEVIEFCKKLHSDETDSELMFMDYENFPGHLYSECMSSEIFDTIIEWANEDDDVKEYVQEYWDEHDISVSISDVKDRHIYSGDIDEYFDEEADDMLCSCPEIVRRCFNYEEYRELQKDDYVVTSNNIFSF